MLSLSSPSKSEPFKKPPGFGSEVALPSITTRMTDRMTVTGLAPSSALRFDSELEFCYPVPSSSWLHLLERVEDSKGTSPNHFCSLSLVLLYNDRWRLCVQPLHKYTSFVPKQKQEDKDGSRQISILGNITQGAHFAHVKNATLKYEEGVVIPGPRREWVSGLAPLENNPAKANSFSSGEHHAGV